MDDRDCGCDFAYAGAHEPSCPRSYLYATRLITMDRDALIAEIETLRKQVRSLRRVVAFYNKTY